MNIQFNEDLTPETSREFLLEWDRDVSKDLSDDYQKNDEFFLGYSKSKSDSEIGIYKKIKLLPIDWTLNPVNAESRGFEWVADAIYDPEAPEEAMKEFFIGYENGDSFGEPASVSSISHGMIGVYEKKKLVR